MSPREDDAMRDAEERRAFADAERESAESAPILHSVTRRNGVAGSFSLVATVEYPGEGRSVVEFVGSVYGGPVVMVTPGGAQHFVTRPDLGSTLSPEWVSAFFGITQ